MQALSHQASPEGNSIGALLFHIAATEKYYSYWIAAGGPTANRLQGEWRTAFRLRPENARIFRARAFGFFDRILSAGQARLDGLLQRKGARWLASPVVVFGNVPANWHYILYHILEDELHHRGQIASLIKALPPRLRPVRRQL